MILPIDCFSCGKVIGHLWFRYQKKVAEYQKEAENKSNDDSGTPEAKALDDLYIHRYCCRRMFLCQPDNLVNMITNRVE